MLRNRFWHFLVPGVFTDILGVYTCLMEAKSLTLKRWWCLEATAASKTVLLRSWPSRLTAGRGFRMKSAVSVYTLPSLDTGGSAACFSGGVGVKL